MFEDAYERMSEEDKLLLFGEGEWMSEPDFHEFKHEGILCNILRNRVGAWCGYVKVPKGHPWYSKDYSDVDCDIHGGLTFSECFDNGDHWIGFDCAHSTDIAPSCEQQLKIVRESMKDKYPDLFKRTDRDKFRPGSVLNPTYKNMNFAIQECKSLAEQVIKASVTPESSHVEQRDSDS